MKDLNNLVIFTKIVESRGFFSGEATRPEPSAVSKAVSRIKREVGAQLLHRTTWAVNPNSDVASFLQRCRIALTDIEEAENSVSGRRPNLPSVDNALRAS